MNAYVALSAGVLCAGVGGELFVWGTVGMARWARVAPGLVAATLAAFATSSPEFTVAVSAALAGRPQLALGDALGSNVVNVAFILALALLFSGLRCQRDSVRRDFPIALLVPVLTGALLFDGTLSRLDGLILLGLFFGWLAKVVDEARRQRRATNADTVSGRGWLPAAACAGGLVLLVGAGRLIVTGATGIARAAGLDEFVIGAVVVAVGTSVPEIAATVVAALRGHDDVSLGTILGSNIFNGLFIVPVAALICPITQSWREAGVALGFGLLAVVSTFPSGDGVIGRGRGVILLGLYGAYLASILHGSAGFITNP